MESATLRFIEESEKHSDMFISIKNIRKGQIFYECEFGDNYKFIASEDSKMKNHGWSCMAKDEDGQKVEFFLSSFTSHPGPSLYIEPLYINKS